MHVAKSIIVLQIYEHFYIHTTKTHKKNNTAPDDKLGAVSFHVSLPALALRSQPATRPAAGQNERTPEYGKSGVLGLKIKTGIKRVSDG